ncbi:unnamed protein product, partial [Pylaiella littoralis]
MERYHHFRGAHPARLSRLTGETVRLEAEPDIACGRVSVVGRADTKLVEGAKVEAKRPSWSDGQGRASMEYRDQIKARAEYRWPLIAAVGTRLRRSRGSNAAAEMAGVAGWPSEERWGVVGQTGDAT